MRRASPTHEKRAARRIKRDQDADISQHFQYISETGAIGANVTSDKFKGARQALADNGLSDPELAAIRVFSGADYEYINPVLAGSRERLQGRLPNWRAATRRRRGAFRDTLARLEQGRELDKNQLRQLRKEAMQHTRSALAGLAMLPDVVVTGYRGMSLTKTELDTEYQIGNVVRWPGFNSTSTDRAAAEGYAATNKAGHVAVLLTLEITGGKDMQAASTVKGEQEVLVLPGAQFKVISISAPTEVNAVWEVRLSQVGAGMAV